MIARLITYLSILLFTPSLALAESGFSIRDKKVQNVYQSKYDYFIDFLQDSKSYQTLSTEQDTNVTFVGRWPGGPCIDVRTDGDYAYIGNGGLFQSLYLTDPDTPAIAGEYLTDGLVWDIEISNSYAYIATGNGMEIVDISDPSNPFLIGKIDRNNYSPFLALAISGDYAYIGDFYGFLHVVDISDPGNPVELSQIHCAGEITTHVEVYGNYLYMIAWDDWWINIVNISDPTDPHYEGVYETNTKPTAIKVSGDYLYVGMAFNPRFQVLDLSTPTEPIVIGNANLNYELWINDIEIDNESAFLATSSGMDGLFIIDISDITLPVEKSNIELMTNTGARAIAVHSGYAYLSAGIGLSIVEILNEDNPIEIGSFPAGDLANRLKVVDKYCYLADGSAGLWIIDVSNPEDPKGIGQFPVQNFAWEVDVQGDYVFLLDSPHNLADSGGVWIIDVSNPANPVEMSRILGILHWTYPLSSLDVSDNYLYVSVPDSGLIIMDITDLESPQFVSFYEIEGFLDDICVSGEYAFLANGNRGLRILDVSNPTDPEEISFLAVSHAIDVIVRNDLAIVANTRELFIINVSNPEIPVEIASFLMSELGNKWTLSASDNFIYVGGNQEVHIIDITFPENPIRVGYIQTRGAVWGVDALENHIYLGNNERGLLIYRNDLLTNIRDNEEKEEKHLKTFQLAQNYPNPFNPSTNILYNLPSGGLVSLELYNIHGQKVKTLVNNFQEKGRHQVTFSGVNLSSGVYFYQLKIGGYSATKKMILIK